MDSLVEDIVHEFEEVPEQAYKPVKHHWFHCKEKSSKAVWTPFSFLDSDRLQNAYTSGTSTVETIVSTDGGRYDVNLSKRERVPVYWRDNPECVRRCSWFHKGSSDARYIPYTEDVADILEEEFRLGVITSVWNRRVALPSGESVVLHSSVVMVHFLKQSSPDSWGGTSPLFGPPLQKLIVRGMEVWSEEVPEDEDHSVPPDHLLFLVHGIGEPKKILQRETEKAQAALRAESVRRGVDTSSVETGEEANPDHLLFLVHGIGSVCDLKFRSLEEVVDDFRSIGRQLVQTHYKSSRDTGNVNRIEVLPVSWHWKLHSEETGIDKLISQITLESVPKLRGFTNDTLLDILFYTSPKFCQTILSTVGDEINRIYTLFKERNPQFKGGISLGGHSLGSVICFDILCHQRPEPVEDGIGDDEVLLVEPSKPQQRQLSYVTGGAGTGQPSVIYPQLLFHPTAFFALGSPIGIFVCMRGLENLGEDFKLPTCPSFFNIFHPFDPVAYRIESLINPELSNLPPLQIPHHKGRKRMHLELKDTVFRVGYDIKQKLMESVKSTWDTFTQFSTFISPRDAAFSERVKEVIQEELIKEVEAEQAEEEASSSADSLEIISESETETVGKLGLLNRGRRVDHVLQEAPLEFFNEYIAAMASHVCYWESADTMLLILKEVYSTMGVEPDSQLSQPTMTIERPVPSNKNIVSSPTEVKVQKKSPLPDVPEQP